MASDFFLNFVRKSYGMNRNAPEIIALRQRIELKMGRKFNSPTQFEFLSGALWSQTGERISSSTLKRLWGYVEGTDTLRESTLRILSNFLGYDSFGDFCNALSDEDAYNSQWIDNPRVAASDLEVGDTVEVTWKPDRYCRFLFEGGLSFVVEESRNSKLQKGDRFECSLFIEGVPMYLNNFVRGRQDPTAFVAGLKDGLTSVRRMHP